MAEKKKGFFQEFKEFISKGNVLDLAVGVIIGGAFTAIVTALTSNVLQPIINYVLGLFGGEDALSNARTILGTKYYVIDDAGNYVVSEGTKVIDWTKTNYIDWGAFISAIINFLLVALVLFIIVRNINKAKANLEEAKAMIEAAKAKDENKEKK